MADRGLGTPHGVGQVAGTRLTVGCRRDQRHEPEETESADEVVAAESRLTASGLTTTGVDEAICCFAEKVETWVEAPDGTRWEWYVKQADHETQKEHQAVPRSCC